MIMTVIIILLSALLTLNKIPVDFHLWPFTATRSIILIAPA